MYIGIYQTYRPAHYRSVKIKYFNWENHFQRVSFGKSFETISNGYHLAILLRPFPEGVKTFENISKGYVLL